MCKGLALEGNCGHPITGHSLRPFGDDGIEISIDLISVKMNNIFGCGLGEVVPCLEVARDQSFALGLIELPRSLSVAESPRVYFL
jgi:hypothetical protein